MVDGHLDDETYLLSLTRGGKGKFMSGRFIQSTETTESFVETFDQLDFLGNQSIVLYRDIPPHDYSRCLIYRKFSVIG